MSGRRLKFMGFLFKIMGVIRCEIGLALYLAVTEMQCGWSGSIIHFYFDFWNIMRHAALIIMSSRDQSAI